MRRYYRYFLYVARHKLFVMIECLKRGLILRAITHDLDKFLPFSFVPYAHTFYNQDGTKAQVRDKTGYYIPTDRSKEFRTAWFYHTRINRHHWQYWVLATENGEIAMPMDTDSMVEMLCDWIGAGKAQGTPGVKQWWTANSHKMRLHPETKIFMHSLVLGADRGII